jgi:hypothetical protein
MKLKRFLPIRHAARDHEGFLTPEGFLQIDRLAHALTKKHGVNPHECLVICSDRLWPLKSAQALCEAMAIPRSTRPACHKSLFSLEEKCDVKAAVETIRGYIDKTQTLIAITHDEMMTLLPPAFGSLILGIDGFPELQYQYAEGLVIDCEKKTCERI